MTRTIMENNTGGTGVNEDNVRDTPANVSLFISTARSEALAGAPSGSVEAVEAALAVLHAFMPESTAVALADADPAVVRRVAALRVGRFLRGMVQGAGDGGELSDLPALFQEVERLLFLMDYEKQGDRNVV